MTDTQHTPGPWKACRSHEDFNGPMWDIDDDERAEYEAEPFVSIEAESSTVMRAHDLFEMRPADARLIAAAPEILGSLLNTADALEQLMREGAVKPGHPYTLHVRDLIDNARAAIAKATD